MSSLNRLSRAVSRAVTRAWGEGVYVMPQTVDQYAGSIPDPARPAKASRGVPSRYQDDGSLAGSRMGSQWQGSRTTVNSIDGLWIAKADYAAIGYELRHGDQIRLTDENRETATFSIASMFNSDAGDTVLQFTFKAQPA